MLKRFTLFAAVFAMFVMLASPASAMLKVLEQELSDELKVIAKQHLANSRNIDAGAITIEDAWVREFFNAKVDVYMVDATIDKGLVTEEKLQVFVRVDTKAVLSEAELAYLVEEDNSLAPDEPAMRILTVPGEPGAGSQPVNQPADLPLNESQATANDMNTTSIRTDALSAAEAAQSETAGYTAYYLTAGVIVLLLLGTGFAIKRSRV